MSGPAARLRRPGRAAVREGFDLTRHPLSLLALGEGGWVQVATFVVSGAMVLAASAGLAREPEALLGPSFQMSFGAVAGLIACARLIGSLRIRM